MLQAGTNGTPDVPDPADVLHSYGRKFVVSDSETALHYFMLAAQAVGGGTEVKGKLFRELLVESKDYGGGSDNQLMQSGVCMLQRLA